MHTIPNDGWVAVCRLDDIPPLGSRRIQRPALPDAAPVALFRTSDDEVHALLDRCPHQGGPLSQGLVFGKAVAGPLHHWTIELRTGCAREPDEGRTPRFEVRLAEGQVLLLASELAGLGTEPIAPSACGRRC